MCFCSREWSPPSSQFAPPSKTRPRRSGVRVQRLPGRKTRSEESKGGGKAMEMRNLKLYMENVSILEENQKLRRKASLLHQENLALMSELQKKFSHLHLLHTCLRTAN